MSVVVNAENIKQFNLRLAGHKSKVERLQLQVEMQEKEVATQLQKLTEALGVQVTEENVYALYEQYKTDLENQLNNGIAILDRIEGKAVAQQAPTNQFGQPTQQVANGFGFGQQVQPAQQMNQPFAGQMGTPIGQPVQQAAPMGQPVQQASPMGQQFGFGQQATPMNHQLNAGMPTQAPQQSQFAGVAQTLGNFDAQQGVNMNNFGGNGVFGV